MPRKKIGTIFVDAGVVMVGDPCYTLPDDGSSRDDSVRDWSKFCHKLAATEHEGYYVPFDVPQVGLVVDSGYGDGEYPVYVEYVKDDWGSGLRVARLIVDFITDEDDF